MKRLLLVAIALLTAAALANDPTINYQGRVTAGGGDYTGQGYFKFVLRSGEGEGLWSNDGSGGTNQPGTAVNVPVNNGLFSVELGEPPMHPISPLAFHEWEVALRTWFSTNASSGFELLEPDARIRPVSLAQIDTREAVIVHNSGNADFDNIQDALDCVATNDDFRVVLVMPGFYEISAPLNTALGADMLAIRGLGAAPEHVFVINTNGPACAMLQGRIENMRFQGAPALFHNGSDEDELELVRCSLGTDENVTTPCAVLQGNGDVDIFETFFDVGGPVGIALLENARFSAVHSAMECWGDTHDNAIAIACSNWQGRASLESCDLEGGEEGLSLGIVDSQHCDFELETCSFERGIGISNSTVQASFANCSIRGKRAVTLVDCGQRNIAFSECRISGETNAVVYVQDALLGADFRNCEINGRDGIAVQVVGTEALQQGQQVEVDFESCHISNWSNGEAVTNMDAIVISNSSTNQGEEDLAVSMELIGSSVSGNIRDGLNSSGADISVIRSSVEGERNGIVGAGGFLELDYSYVEADDGDAVNFSGGQLDMMYSDVCGDGNGRGIYAQADPQMGMPILIQDCTLESPGGPALECEGGRYICMGSVFLSGLDAPVLLRETNNVMTLDRCRLLSHADLFGATNANPALLLYGAGAVATPRLTHCLLEPASTAEYCIDVGGGAATGNVYMINSCVSTGLSPNVGILDPGPALGYGNYVVPAGP